MTKLSFPIITKHKTSTTASVVSLKPISIASLHSSEGFCESDCLRFCWSSICLVSKPILIWATAWINHLQKCILMCVARLAPVLKTIFINVSYHILVASLPLMALKTEPSELDWLQVYDMTHWWKIVLRAGASLCVARRLRLTYGSAQADQGLHMKRAWIQSYPLSIQQRIRCTGWSESCWQTLNLLI